VILKDILNNVHSSRHDYPNTDEFFTLKNDLKMNCTVVTITQDEKIIWRCPPGPCITGSDSLYKWLCDGLIPICQPFVPGNGEYSSTGCRHWRKCNRLWKKRVI